MKQKMQNLKGLSEKFYLQGLLLTILIGKIHRHFLNIFVVTVRCYEVETIYI